MTKLNVTNVLAGAVTAAALTFAVSGNALAHGGHMGGNMGATIGGNLGHTMTTSLVDTNKTNLVQNNRTISIGDHDRDHDRDRDRRRFRFPRLGYVDAAPVCFYRWTHLGRVRICPDLDY